MRLFVALRPSSTAIEHLDDFLNVRRAAADFRWTPAEHFHLTLAFLGDVPDYQLDELIERLAGVAGRRTSFDTRVAGGGAFPHAATAKVLWAGLELDGPGRAHLGQLSASARAAGSRVGARGDGSRFRPHLTVARLSRPAEVSRWVRLLDSYAGPTWPVTHLELVASYLGEGPRQRPRHEVIATLPLEWQRG
ncbi:MAG: RNA 2',3'-cyclic phosphodiesterase [Nocardioides sp.]